MTQITRDVVVDLWPLYASGEASTDTRALVEAFIASDPALTARLRDQEVAALKPASVALPANHERATLLRTQRRRARQSMLVNALALLASGAMTAFYAFDGVPRLAAAFAMVGRPLPTGMHAAATASAWILRLGLPLAIVLVPLTLAYRKRLRVPRFLESGTALAIATGVILVLTQLWWLGLLNETSIALADAFKTMSPGH